jgi:hypothetical protein
MSERNDLRMVIAIVWVAWLIPVSVGCSAPQMLSTAESPLSILATPSSSRDVYVPSVVAGASVDTRAELQPHPESAVSPKDILEWVVTLIVASAGWIFAWVRDRTVRREERQLEAVERARSEVAAKVDVVKAYVEAFSDLAALYRLRARREQSLLRDANGRFVTDESGKPVVETHAFEPEQRFESVIESRLGTDLDGAIALKIFETKQQSERVHDIAFELDPTKELSKQLATLAHVTVHTVEFWIEADGFDEMVQSIHEAQEIRRQIRARLDQMLR